MCHAVTGWGECWDADAMRICLVRTLRYLRRKEEKEAAEKAAAEEDEEKPKWERRQAGAQLASPGPRTGVQPRSGAGTGACLGSHRGRAPWA